MGGNRGGSFPGTDSDFALGASSTDNFNYTSPHFAMPKHRGRYHITSNPHWSSGFGFGPGFGEYLVLQRLMMFGVNWWY